MSCWCVAQWGSDSDLCDGNIERLCRVEQSHAVVGVQPALSSAFTPLPALLCLCRLSLALVTQALEELLLAVTPRVPGFSLRHLSCWTGSTGCTLWSLAALLAGTWDPVFLFFPLGYFVRFISGLLSFDTTVQHLSRNKKSFYTWKLNTATCVQQTTLHLFY